MLLVWPGILAATLGAVPVLYLSGLRRRGESRRLAWWLVASAFGVSFVADLFNAAGWHPLAHQVYPVLQAALVALVLLERPAFVGYVALLLFAAILSILWRGAGGYDVILRVVAWGGVSVFAGLSLERGVLRSTLSLGFAGMLVAWAWYTLAPGLGPWAALQLARLGATVGFCVAAKRAVA